MDEERDESQVRGAMSGDEEGDSMNSCGNHAGNVANSVATNSHSHAEESDDLSCIKRKPKKESRKCTVCGDKALGFNFDAITCESCKAFFRRNANKMKVPKCMFQRSCIIDANTRRFCSACRLTKCFSAGMKKEMILGDEERQKRIQKVMQNRAKKLELLQKQTSIDASSKNSTLQNSNEQNSSPNLSNLCIKIESVSDDHCCSTSSKRLPEDSELESLSSMTLSYPLPTDADLSRRLLSDTESQFIDYINESYCVTFGSTSEEVPLMLEATTLEVLMNHLGCLVKLLIRFAKKLTDFTSLPQAVQMSLLRGSLLDCICWRSAQLFNIERGKWVSEEGDEVPVHVLNAVFGQVDPGIQEEYINLIGFIKQLLGTDMVIIALVQCVVLFTPEYSSDGYRSLASSTQDKYMRLLKHHLEAHHDWDEAFSIYSKLLTSICRMKDYTSRHSKSLYQCDTSQVEPLLLEVFNIPPTSR